MSRPRTISDEALLHAARDCFLEHGPAASTALIADRVGLSQAALFKRFGTKDELLVAALAPRGPFPWIDRLERGPDQRPIDQQLEEIALVFSAWLRDALPAISTLRASGLCPARLQALLGDPPPILTLRAAEGWLGRAAAAGRIRACSPHAVAMALVGALHGRPILLHLNPEQAAQSTDADYVRTLVDVIWRGLTPEEDG